MKFPFSADLVKRTASREPSGKRLGKTARAIVDLMLETPDITTPELAESLGRSERAIELQINKLRESQIIRRIGPAKGGHWDVIE